MSLRFGVLTASDRSSKGERRDISGPALIAEIRSKGWNVFRHSVLPDDFKSLRETLQAWVERGDLDVILTTGGTGFSPRDVTPEATLSVVERQAPGLAEAMRMAGLRITPHAMLSRAVAGIRGRVLIINLPGSPKAAVENFRVISPVLEHAVELMRGDPLAESHHSLVD
jgi:molybdenum cofactor synthesis domain-containing protein